MKGKLAAVVLVLVATSSLALGVSDFEFIRNENGQIGRFKIDNKIAVIQINKDNKEWTGYVKNCDNVTISDQTGASKTSHIKDLPAKDQEEIDSLMKDPLRGTTIIGKAGKFFLNANKGEILNVEVNEHGSVSTLAGPLDVFLYADRSRLNYQHVFTFLHSKHLGTIEVSKTNNIRIYPLAK